MLWSKHTFIHSHLSLAMFAFILSVGGDAVMVEQKKKKKRKSTRLLQFESRDTARTGEGGVMWA